MSKKFLVLTAVTDNKDTLQEPQVVFDNCDYIAVTDRQYDVGVWNQQPIIRFSTIDNFHHRRNAKVYKVLSTIFFPDYEYIVWMDGTHQLKANPESILQQYGDADLYAFKHLVRDCVYEELKAVSGGVEYRPVAKQHYNYYKFVNMPTHYGLNEASCMVKKNSSKMKILELSWWEQICKFSSRDQCSLNYCLWQLDKSNVGFVTKYITGSANIPNGNGYFEKERNHNYN